MNAPATQPVQVHTPVEIKEVEALTAEEIQLIAGGAVVVNTI